MTWDVALILGIDGLANGAVYLLAGLGLVLIFSVTRVVFVPFGDIAAFAALTLAAFETNRLPPTIGLVAVLAVIATLTEIGSLPNGPRVSIRPWSASTVACVLIVVSLYFKAFCSSTKT